MFVGMNYERCFEKDGYQQYLVGALYIEVHDKHN